MFIPDPDADFLPSRIPGSKRHPISDPEPQHCIIQRYGFVDPDRDLELNHNVMVIDQPHYRTTEPIYNSERETFPLSVADPDAKRSLIFST